MQKLTASADPFQRAVLAELIEPEPVVTTEESERVCRKLSDEAVEIALLRVHGNISAAARALGCQRHAIQYRIQNSPILQRIVNQSREMMCDEAESGLLADIKAREPYAIALMLKSPFGRVRGYADKPDNEPTGPGTFNFVIICEQQAPSQAELAARRGEPPPPPPPPQLPAPAPDPDGPRGFF